MSYYQLSRITQVIAAIGLSLYVIALCPMLWLRELLAVASGMLLCRHLYLRLNARIQDETTDAMTSQTGASTISFMAMYLICGALLISFVAYAALI